MTRKRINNLNSEFARKLRALGYDPSRINFDNLTQAAMLAVAREYYRKFPKEADAILNSG